MATDRTALLIIRIQFNEEVAAPLIVQLRETNDVSAGFEGLPVAVDVDSLPERVSVWLAGSYELVGT